MAIPRFFDLIHIALFMFMFVNYRNSTKLESISTQYRGIIGPLSGDNRFHLHSKRPRLLQTIRPVQTLVLGYHVRHSRLQPPPIAVGRLRCDEFLHEEVGILAFGPAIRSYFFKHCFAHHGRLVHP